MHRSSRLLTVAALIVSAQAVADPPAGWLLSSRVRADYDAGVDKAVTYGGKPSAYLRSRVAEPAEFATLMQMFDADHYRGKRVRLSAQVKSEDVKRWSGLWLRVDASQGSTAFDNMQDRPIVGTAGWQRFQVVLDVDGEATRIAFGILLDGPGAVWLSDLSLEVVDKSVPTTDRPARHNKEPVNLDFSK